MSGAPRRVPPPQVYSQVPSSPPRGPSYNTPLNASAQQRNPYGRSAHEETVQGVQSGAIGGGYGPYSVCYLLCPLTVIVMLNQWRCFTFSVST